MKGNKMSTNNVGANLANASQFFKLASYKGKPEPGFRVSRVIVKETKQGEKALSESLAIIVPDNLSVSGANDYAALREVMAGSLRDLQDKLIRRFAIAGDSQVWHDSISLAKLEAFAVESNETLGRLTHAEIAELFKSQDNVAVIHAAYETATGKEISDANCKQVNTVCEAILRKLCDSEPMFEKTVQEVFCSAVADNIDGDTAIKLRAKVKKAIETREKFESALADTGF